MVGKKVPALAKMPQNGSSGFKEPVALQKVQRKIKDTHFHFFEKQMLLHKILSVTKVWILKIETKVDQLLHGIRKKAQQLDKETKRKR